MVTERDSSPVLFMANHPIMVRTFAGILELKNEREDLVVACDALYKSVLERSGLTVLGIDSPSKTLWSGKAVYKARTWLTRALGESLHVYDDALKGEDVVDAMVDTLRDGKDLFICPSGVSDPDARWRSGVGKVAIAVSEEPVRAGFVYIPSSFFSHNQVEYGPTVGSLLPIDGELHPRAVATLLREEYQRRMLEKD